MFKNNLQHVKSEIFNFIVESFVIKKQFGQQTKRLTINFVNASKNFKNSQILVSVNLVSWGLFPFANVHLKTKRLKGEILKFN